MRSRLVRNLQIGFGLSLLFLVCISAASFISIQNLFKSSDLVDHSKIVVRSLESALSIMKDAETGQRGYLLTNNEVFLEPYNGSYKRAINTIEEFQRLTRDNPQQQVNGASIKAILINRLNILQRLIDKKRAGKTIEATDLNAGKNAMDALRAAINKAEIDEDRLLRSRVGQLDRFTSLTPIFLVIATLASIIISVLAYYRVINGINERARLHAALELKERETASINDELAAANEELNAANEELASANEELNAASDELAAYNEELNASNEELVSANEELNAVTDELSKSRESLQALNDELEERVKNRTRELTESEGRFRVIMATMPQIAWTNNPEGEVTFFNRHWYVYTGLSGQQSTGWGWASAIHPDDLSYASAQYRSILESAEEGEFETRKRRSDGEYRWHLVRMQPVANEAGETQLWVGTATDVDDLKNLQQQKDDFISIASHELKTPVTSLKMSLQLLDRTKDNPSPSVAAKLIGQANKSLDRVGVLIDDLLNVSKLNHGQLHLSKTRFNISELVNECCQYIRIESEYSIITEGDPQLEAVADAERIEQVIVNFVNNAIKYAPLSKEIRIKIEKAGDMARISVSDKGPGIQTEKIPHLFERYYRVDSQGIQFSGLGLGLYISSEIVKRHGGQIGVDSEVGKGSTFWFTIPLEG
ncbi:MAG: ATP-binding protein [Mucilaginibacter sp.]